MSRHQAPLALSRQQILAFRQRAGSLTNRLPAGSKSLRRAAWAGLQDSVPRAALLSLHARVEAIQPSISTDPSLVQLWGPRYSDYVIAAEDLAVFSLGRLPDHPGRRARCHNTASALSAFLNGKRMPFGEAARAMGVPHNSLRYGAPTGTVLIHWDGIHQPVVWSVPSPAVDLAHARLELARRYLHIFGPAVATSFAHWAGIGQTEARTAFQQLADTLIAVRTPVGDGWILADDEADFRTAPWNPSPARLLPSGDTYFLFWGTDRELLVPDPKQRAQLWTTRVWPGALLVGGEIVGVWRRSASDVSIETWRTLKQPEWEAVESEAAALPLPGLKSPITITRS